jgi:hypothetical protein
MVLGVVCGMCGGVVVCQPPRRTLMKATRQPVKCEAAPVIGAFAANELQLPRLPRPHWHP